MSSIYIHKLKPRKELPDYRQRLIRDIFTLRAPDKQSRFLEPRRCGIFEWEIPQIIQGRAEGLQRDAEFLGLRVFGPVEVAEEELSNSEGLFRTWLVTEYEIFTF